MPDITLTSKPILGGYTHQANGVSIVEKTTLGIVSVACPRGQEPNLAKQLKQAFGAALPDVSAAELSDSGTMRWLGLQPLQWFVLFEHADASTLPVALIQAELDEAAYCTDQSDSWVTLELSGPNVLTALERICPLDLHKDSFTVGSVARTTMEHLGVIITRTDDDQYLMMSASSSAKSFLHAITASIKNIST